LPKKLKVFELASYFFIEDILYTLHFTALWTVTLWVAAPLVPRLSYAPASWRLGARNLCAPGPAIGALEDGVGIYDSIHQLNNKELFKKDIFTEMLFRQTNAIWVPPNIPVSFKPPGSVPESRVCAKSDIGC
jgi:hypothetical protein